MSMSTRNMWLGLVLCRLVWTCLPQAGYIHPDEFFQSVEVASGDILGIRVVRAWEFNSTFPLRSIIPIYLSTAMPLLLLKALSAASGYVIGWYSLTVAVRLMVTLLSLITDYTAMQLARWLSRDAVLAAVVMATSYVSLVYYTRTFSNTLESFLCAALLYSVTCRSYNVVVISTLVVVGIFNRPTFIVYAAVPYLWWLFSDGIHRVMTKATCSLLTAVPVTSLLIICDSIYFGQLDINNLNIVDFNDIVSIFTRNLTVTPLNFVLYNVQSGNLVEHGIHPRFTHFAVNVPLLFGAMSISFFGDIYTWFLQLFATRKWKPATMCNRRLMLTMCCLTAVGLLSVFPHQEPRFLVPLLPVFAALYACEVVASPVLIVLWVAGNVSGCLFYGCVHQAGVVPCLGYLQQNQLSGVERHVFFWHTYTAPQHLLILPPQSAHTQDHVHTTLRSLEGNSVQDLIHHLTLINGTRSSQRRENPEVMVAASSSEHRYLVYRAAEAGVRLDLNQSFWPHLSAEHLPKIDDILCHISTSSQHTNSDIAAADAAAANDVDFCDRTLIGRIKFLTALHLYQVTFL